MVYKWFVTGLVSFLILCCQPAGKPAAPAADSTATPGAGANTPVSAQQQPAAPGTGSAQNPSAGSFIPTGYTVLDSAEGDANLDAYPDKILVLKKDGEEKTSDVIDHPEKRPLLIMAGQSGNTYKLAARSDNAVLCVDCGGVMGDPFTDVVIRKGYFSVEHAGGSSWRWTRIVTFKYSPGDNNWVLYKDGHENFHASEPDKAETKIYTVKDFGKVPFTRFDIYKDQ